MKKIIIDTNAFLRFFLNDIPEQKEAVSKLLQDAKSYNIDLFIPQIIIFELHFILDKYYHISKEDIVATLQPLISTKYIEIESREILLKALTLYQSTSNSFVDCFLVTTAHYQEAELFTFDKKLKKLQ